MDSETLLVIQKTIGASLLAIAMIMLLLDTSEASVNGSRKRDINLKPHFSIALIGTLFIMIGTKAISWTKMKYYH